MRVRAKAHGAHLAALRAEARRDPPPESPRALNLRLYPIASIDGKGTLTWSPPLLTNLPRCPKPIRREPKLSHYPTHPAQGR